MTRVLAISAHPDDETIGAGGTLAKHAAAGDELFWCIVTQAYAPEWSEGFIAAAAQQVDRVREVYGFRSVVRCGLPTVKLNTVPSGQIAEAIRRVVSDCRPEIVYTPSLADVNEDHRIVHNATLVAARPLPGSPIRQLLAYEIVTTAHFGVHGFEPNVYVDITATLPKKLEAMACYATELRQPPHPRSLESIELAARERGIGVGVGAAERFQLVRALR